MNLHTLITTLEQNLKRTIVNCKQYDYGPTINYKLNKITINNTEYAAEQLFLIPKNHDATLCVLNNKTVTQFKCSEIETISI